MDNSCIDNQSFLQIHVENFRTLRTYIFYTCIKRHYTINVDRNICISAKLFIWDHIPWHNYKIWLVFFSDPDNNLLIENGMHWFVGILLYYIDNLIFLTVFIERGDNCINAIFITTTTKLKIFNFYMFLSY